MGCLGCSEQRGGRSHRVSCHRERGARLLTLSIPGQVLHEMAEVRESVRKALAGVGFVSVRLFSYLPFVHQVSSIIGEYHCYYNLTYRSRSYSVICGIRSFSVRFHRWRKLPMWLSCTR